jgi:hypothetical protein
MEQVILFFEDGRHVIVDTARYGRMVVVLEVAILVLEALVACGFRPKSSMNNRVISTGRFKRVSL